MRSTRITNLAVAFAVGCGGAWAADAAVAQESAPKQERKSEGQKAAEELERLLEELLGREPARPAQPRSRPAPRPPAPPVRPQDPSRAVERQLEELLRRMGVRPLTPEERAERDREMERARRDFERRMGEMNRRMAELRKRMEEDLRRMFGEDFDKHPFGPGGLFGGRNNPFGPVQPGRPGGGGSSRSFKLGPGGVTEATLTEGDTTITGKRNAQGIFIEVTKPGADGTPQTTEYRAKDEAEFHKKYPDQKALYERLFGRGRGFFVEFGPSKLRTQTTKAPKKPTMISSKLGFTADALSGMLRTQLALPAGQGIYVKSVTPGGWAERAGIEARDVIAFVDKKPVRGLADLESVISGKTDSDATVTLVLHRQGVVLELGVPK